MPSSKADAARDTSPFEARAGVRADGPLTVDLSEPPAAGFFGCLDAAGGDLLLERFVAILLSCKWGKKSGTYVPPSGRACLADLGHTLLLHDLRFALSNLLA